MEYNVITHHGIRGQKWGTRRFQKSDGSLTPAGKKRVGSDDSNSKESSTKMSAEDKKALIKKVAIGLAAVGTVAAAALYVKNHPDQIASVMSKLKNINVKDLSSKAKENGKRYVQTSIKLAKEGVKEGVKEGMKEAPKTVAKAVVTGLILNQAKRLLDKGLGKEETERIFKANNKKKLSNFWKVDSSENNNNNNDDD